MLAFQKTVFNLSFTALLLAPLTLAAQTPAAQATASMESLQQRIQAVIQDFKLDLTSEADSDRDDLRQLWDQILTQVDLDTLSVSDRQRFETIETDLSQADLSVEQRIEQLEERADLQATKEFELIQSLEDLQVRHQLDFFGSLALRYCGMFNGDGQVLGNTFQTRLSAGLRGQAAPGWNYALRVLSNDNQSFNLSWFPFTSSSTIPRSPITLDRFHIDWQATQHNQALPALRLRVGKAPNFLLGDSQLLFDEDVSFTGLQQEASWQALTPNWEQLSLSLGQQAVLIQGAFIQTSLLAAKVDSSWRWEDWNLKTGLSYSQFLGASALAPLGYEQGYLGAYSQRNRISNQHFDSQFQLLNAHASLNWQSPLGPVTLLADYAHNVGARDQNKGALVGLSWGQRRQPGDWKLEYNYRYLEQDYQLSLMVDEVFAGTGVSGHVLEGGVQLTDKASWSLTWINRHSLTDTTVAPLNIIYTTLRQDF